MHACMLHIPTLTFFQTPMKFRDTTTMGKKDPKSTHVLIQKIWLGTHQVSLPTRVADRKLWEPCTVYTPHHAIQSPSTAMKF